MANDMDDTLFYPLNSSEYQTVLGEDERKILESLTNTSRVTRTGAKLQFTSLLKRSRLVYVFAGILLDTGEPVIIKTGFRYELLDPLATQMENVFCDMGLDIQLPEEAANEGYAKEHLEKFICNLSAEQKLEFYFKLDEALTRRLYTFQQRPLDNEAFTHQQIDKAIQKAYERMVLPRFILYDVDYMLPVEFYVMEHLGVSMVKQPMSYTIVARDILTALKVINRAGYIHGDISVNNIVRNNQGGAALIDFGVALPTWSLGSTFGESTDPEAPEGFRGTNAFAAVGLYQGMTTKTDDIESLCYVLELLAGHQLPWTFMLKNYNEVYKAKLTYIPKEPSIATLYQYIRQGGNTDLDYCISLFNEKIIQIN